MSNCNYYHCGQPRACEHYGWCCGHRAGLATWLCEHMKPKEECHIKQPQEQCAQVVPKSLEETLGNPDAQALGHELEQHVGGPYASEDAMALPQEQPIEDNLEEPPCAQVLQSQHVGEPYVSEETMAPLLLRAESLPYYLDKIEEYNEPQELIEQLAKSQTEYNSKIEAEMEEMRKKLAHYEEQKKIVDEIHQLEEKVKNLQPKEPEKKAPPIPKRTISIPTTTPRPVVSKAPLRSQKK